MSKNTHLSARCAKRWITVLAVLSAVCIAAAFWILSDGGPFSKTFTSTGYVMGSYMQQTIYSRNGEAAAAEALTRAAETEALISWRVEGSDIQKLNAAAGTSAVSADSRTLSILNSALDVATRSDGAFDPTILPVSSLWNFDGDSPTLPAAEQISKFLPHVAYTELILTEGTAFLQETGSAVDLGAAGKGAACDDALAVYAEYGVTGAVVAVGGSIGLYGQKPDHTPWTIAVRDPAKEDLSASLGTIETDAVCISTSGSYEKTFTQDGVSYHHLLDPKTGYPAQSGLVSVTVLHKSGLLADMLSTACFVLGTEKGSALLEEYGACGIFVDQNQGVTMVGDVNFTLTAAGYHLLSEKSPA